MLRLLLFGSAIVSVVLHCYAATRKQAVHRWLVLVVRGHCCPIAGRRNLNLLIPIGIKHIRRAACGHLPVFQLIGSVVAVGRSCSVDVLQSAVAPGVIRERLSVGICSSTVFPDQLVLFVVASGDSGGAAAFNHHDSVTSAVIAIFKLLLCAAGGISMNDMRRLTGVIIDE